MGKPKSKVINFSFFSTSIYLLYDYLETLNLLVQKYEELLNLRRGYEDSMVISVFYFYFLFWANNFKKKTVIVAAAIQKEKETTAMTGFVCRKGSNL